MTLDGSTLTMLARLAQPEVLDGSDDHLDEAECELLLHRLLTTPRGEPKDTEGRVGWSRRRRLAVGGSLVAALAAASIVALALVGVQSRGPLARSKHPTHVQTVADISAKTSSAVLAASQTGILEATSSMVGSGGTTVPSTESWSDLSNGQAVLETLDPDGSPGTVIVRTSSGTVRVIDYSDRAWWTASSFRGANGQTLSPTVGSAQELVQGIETALANGSMQIVARDQLVNGQATTELSGSELPSALGLHLMIWISEATNLPVQSRSIDSQPTVLAPSGGLQTNTTYRWAPLTAPNLAKLSPTIPTGFSHLAGPPPSQLAIPSVG